MLAAVIALTEISFWVLVASGLVARYPLRRPRLGAGLLMAAPLVDLMLLAASTVDLRRGGDASIVHALAAIYIGVSVGFGPAMIRWADVRFAYRFAGGPAPVKPSKHGIAAAWRQVRDWLRHLVAWSIGAGLMLGGVLLVGDPDRTKVLLQYPAIWGVVLVIDAVITGFDVAAAVRTSPERDQESEPDARAPLAAGLR